MTDIVEISELPNDQMTERLKEKPDDFFKQFKDLPDSVAEKIYQVRNFFSLL